jgi:hypothetical protein
MRGSIAGGLVALALAGPTFAGPLMVDGSVSDWGIAVADNNGSNFNSLQLSGPAVLLGYKVEDQNDLASDGGYLGPHYGGQNYDAEFMAVASQGDRIFVVIATGQRPDNGLPRYSPGDIRITADNGLIYGIEVGGGAGGGAGGALTQGAPGSTYALNSQGYTVFEAASARVVGSVWLSPTWLTDAIQHLVPVQMAENGGTQVGTADFVYTRDSVTQQHSIIELSLDRAIFGGATQLDFFWAPSCNNDVLLVHDDLPARVPEPGTLAALGIGLLGFRLTRRRR